MSRIPDHTKQEIEKYLNLVVREVLRENRHATTQEVIQLVQVKLEETRDVELRYVVRKKKKGNGILIKAIVELEGCCDGCLGAGRVNDADDPGSCPDCHGSGSAPVTMVRSFRLHREPEPPETPVSTPNPDSILNADFNFEFDS